MLGDEPQRRQLDRHWPLPRRQVIGAMQFIISGSERAYDADDVALAQAVGGRVASALENHRLAEGQREIAHTLQRSLLPDRVPDVPGVDVAVAYWAAGEGTEVGGDFYDLFAMGTDRFGVVIGDVCGHGPRAAALTSLSRHSVRLCAWRGDRPAEVLGHLNTVIGRDEAHTFCTLGYGDMTRGENGVSMTMANGGHPPPIVVGAGGSMRKIMPTGPLVGGLDHATFGEATVHLETGDTIVFYTDGATDVRPPGGLSDDELLSLIVRSAAAAQNAQEVVTLLSGELEARLPFASRQDDVALLVLRVGAAVPAPT